MTITDPEVRTGQTAWKHQVLIGSLAVVGAVLAYCVSGMAFVAFGWWPGFLLLVTLLTGCGVAATALGGLRLRWAYSVTLLLLAGASTWTWHLTGTVGFGVQAALFYCGLFAVGATVGSLARRLG